MLFEEFQSRAASIPTLAGRHCHILYGLVRWLQPQTVVEVGSFHGGSAVWLARGLQDNGSGRLTCIDDFSLMGVTEAHLRFHLASCGVGDVVTILKGHSSVVEWPERVDMAFIDGDHSETGCTADVDTAFRHGATCICVHDTTSWWGPRKWLETMRTTGAAFDFYDIIEVPFDDGLTIALKEPKKPLVTYREQDYPTGAI